MAASLVSLLVSPGATRKMRLSGGLTADGREFGVGQSFRQLDGERSLAIGAASAGQGVRVDVAGLVLHQQTVERIAGELVHAGLLHRGAEVLLREGVEGIERLIAERLRHLPRQFDDLGLGIAELLAQTGQDFRAVLLPGGDILIGALLDFRAAHGVAECRAAGEVLAHVRERVMMLREAAEQLFIRRVL